MKLLNKTSVALRLTALSLLFGLLVGCATPVTSIMDQMGSKLPTELSVSADCYVPTFYQEDESNLLGSGHGFNLQYNYNLCKALIDQFTSIAPTVFPATRVLPESLVSFGGQLGGRYSVKTLTGYHKIVPSETSVIVPAVDNKPLEISSIPLISLMSKARKFAHSYAYEEERLEIMYDGGRLHERSKYFQALTALSSDDAETLGGEDSALLMVVSGQLLGELYSKANRYEVDSQQMTSNAIRGILSAATSGSFGFEYTTTRPRLYMTFLFVSPKGRVEYANLAGSLACEDPSDSARLLIESAFVGGLKTLSTKGFCSGDTLETLILDR